MKLFIAGDLAPTKSNMVLFNNADIDTLLGEELRFLWNSADIRILNLEIPVTDTENPIDKIGPSFIAPLSTVNGIKKMNPSLITLANNHILDQGEQGLESTQDILNKNDIAYIGSGKNIKEASKPFIFNRDGLNIGVYACTEHEFSTATPSTAGANPFDFLESIDHIKELKEKCDYVIVLYHGGRERYRYPTPYLQSVCRKIVQKGADLIICQHSHCIGSFEKYEGSTIIYGQGNFIFDKSDNEYVNTGFIIDVNIDEAMHIDYIPIIKEGNRVRLASGEKAETIIKQFRQRSSDIQKEGFIKKQFNKLADENIQRYLGGFSGIGKLMKGIDRYLFKGLITKRRYKKRQLLTLKNYLECETHREVVSTGLNNILRKINKY